MKRINKKFDLVVSKIVISWKRFFKMINKKYEEVPNTYVFQKLEMRNKKQKDYQMSPIIVLNNIS